MTTPTSSLATALSKRIARDLELTDWRVVQEALSRHAPQVLRLDVHPNELTADEYETLCDMVAYEMTSQ